jgi:hypothetical protein
VFFSVRLEGLEIIGNSGRQKYPASLQLSAPLSFSYHFYSKRMLQHVPLVPFSGRAFNLLAARWGASFSRLLLEEAMLHGVASAWLVLQMNPCIGPKTRRSSTKLEFIYSDVYCSH